MPSTGVVVDSGAVPRGIISVIRAASTADAVAIGTAVAAAGVRNLEVTFTVPDAPAAIRALRERTDTRVGAGTVVDVAQAQAAADAGASFIVSPYLEVAVVDYALEAGLPSVVGALSPTEISRAIAAGGAAVKLFPIASVGGASYLSAVAEVFPDVTWVVSGGITPDSVHAYERAGSSGICLGGALVDRGALSNHDHDALIAHARSVVATIGAP